MASRTAPPASAARRASELAPGGAARRGHASSDPRPRPRALGGRARAHRATLLWAFLGAAGRAPTAAVADAGAAPVLRKIDSMGFPVPGIHLGDLEAGGRGGSWGEDARKVLPENLAFTTAEENIAICRRAAVHGHSVAQLLAGQRPPADSLATWVREEGLLAFIATACPQLTMLLLLLHAENALLAPHGTVDMHEAVGVQVQFNILKMWLQNVVFPDGEWERPFEGWPFDEIQSRMLARYKMKLSGAYNDIWSEEEPREPDEVVVPAAMLGAWDVAYDNGHEARAELLASGLALFAGADGAGSAVLQPASAPAMADGWQYLLEGHYAAGKYELLRLDGAALEFRHWTGEFWVTAVASRRSAPAGGAAPAPAVAAEAFYAVCPEARGSAFIRALAPAAGAAGTYAVDAGETTHAAAPLAELVEGPIPVSMGLVGNALSLYWQARALAVLSGAAFAATGGRGEGTFVQHLPRKAAAKGRFNATALREACASCGHEHQWRWPHLCLGAWTHIRDAIRAGTRRALRARGLEAAAQSELRARDAVAHLRCFPRFTDEYPLAGFSLYDEIPAPWRKAQDLRFLIVAGALGPVCRRVAEALGRHLLARYPQAAIEHRYSVLAEPGKMTEDRVAAEAVERDFALLVHAPVLFRTPGSFSLWAALARSEGNEGLVVSTPNVRPPLATWAWERGH